ncbi:alpha/beta hydrolase family protein [Cognatilysobacter lacus]|uniref:Alpha/beta hydrolase n=1 Tax=Cognatilysobacter lacus TaxID=1643323 RepID=A0A5D8Z9C1_9GAMM|nr:alpha/beta hydrolase [Lysobacter lacus]TZF90712.1 alpha/beta hydrolase [Lysobacter lacus]
MKKRIVAALAAAILCLTTLVLVIRLRTDQLLFPNVPGTSTAPVVASLAAGRSSSGRMLLRGYGVDRLGCVLFFPGQHGGIANYEKTLIPSLASQGIRVFAASYPGQDGAPGAADVDGVKVQASKAVLFASGVCGPERTVVVGRSLGTMVAAESLNTVPAAGLVLISAAPSLSAAFHAQLRTHWYTRPLRMLPASAFVQRDISLTGALGERSLVPLVIFQGTRDLRTPLELLRIPGVVPHGAQIVMVAGGTHENTYLLANHRIVEAVKWLLSSHESDNSSAPNPLRGPT